jgi:hypothetical protein
MYTDATLPFPRGSTYKDNGELALSSNTTCGAGIVGRLFETTDSSGRPLVLRAVRADAALSDIGRNCVSYTAAKVGFNADALCASAGVVASIVDDAYPTTFDVAAYDIFYVVEEGYVLCTAETDVAAGGAVAAYTNGNVKLATAGQYVIGIATENDGTTTASCATIQVSGGLKLSDASG